MTAIQTLTGTLAVDSRFRGNDDIHGGRAQHCHSRESGNPHLLSEPQCQEGKAGTADSRSPESLPLYLAAHSHKRKVAIK